MAIKLAPHMRLWARFKLAWKVLFRGRLTMDNSRTFFDLTPDGAMVKIDHQTKKWFLLNVKFKVYKGKKS